MSPKSPEILLKRVASLVKQNKELEQQLKNLTTKYKELQQLLEEKEQILAQVPKEKIKIPETSKHLKFDMVTVMFANIHGFDKLHKYKNSQDLIDGLDTMVFNFDQILKKYKIEKIKTIGDAYMCAGGIPKKNITNPVQVVLAAIEIRKILKELDKDLKLEEVLWSLSFGIHTGPCVAITMGKKKMSYDIKGDTVNIATRIEASGSIDKILISVMTYELVKEFFDCEHFGFIPVKYKGNLELFEVRRIKPEMSADEQGMVPNDYFNVKFLLMQFIDLQEFMLNKLEKELPSYLYYHNVKHTVDVVTQVELIGWGEGVSEEEILLLKTAALFHDAGHIMGYDEHEYKSTLIAREMLPQYGYTQKQIDDICDIIMATKLPPQPQNVLQRIICDADLDYLGRADFIPVSNTLFEELKEQKKIQSLNEWNKLQIKFISRHQYFTHTAQILREVYKQAQIERIKALIED